jgi:hypothetical protein
VEVVFAAHVPERMDDRSGTPELACIARIATRYLDLRSNSPLRTPPRKASHSAVVKFSIPPRGFLLSRTRMTSSPRPWTSTQFPLYVLRELFIHPLDGIPPDCHLLETAKSRFKPTSIVTTRRRHSKQSEGSQMADTLTCRTSVGSLTAHVARHRQFGGYTTSSQTCCVRSIAVN